MNPSERPPGRTQQATDDRERCEHMNSSKGETETCPLCGGTGKVGPFRCTLCKGKGKVPK